MTSFLQTEQRPYRGRIAPSPTGWLHLGHARTFWTAQERAHAHNGMLVFRSEDLDAERCKAEFVTAMFEDLRWFGLNWQEGPDCGGEFGPYKQSQRHHFYRVAFEKLQVGNFIYPCTCSRKDLQSSVAAPHAGDDELIYPGTCRSNLKQKLSSENHRYCWRFRVTDGETIAFTDSHFGLQHFVAGKDFGDFVVWRHDGIPAYQLAVVVDDAAMHISEVVRGADLLLSTARQILIYRALGLVAPAFYHCPLMTDENGIRLAKRHDALSLRLLRAQGSSVELLRQQSSWRNVSGASLQK